LLICQHSGYLRVGANRCPLLQSRIMDGFTLPMPFGVVPSVMFPRFGPIGGLAMNQPATMVVPGAIATTRASFRRASTVAGPVETPKLQPPC